MQNDDVGTRLQHYIELFELWNEAKTILENSEARFQTKMGRERLVVIKNAMSLLQVVMENEYNEYNYAAEINRIPKDKKE